MSMRLRALRSPRLVRNTMTGSASNIFFRVVCSATTWGFLLFRAFFLVLEVLLDATGVLLMQ